MAPSKSTSPINVSSSSTPTGEVHLQNVLLCEFGLISLLFGGLASNNYFDLASEHRCIQMCTYMWTRIWWRHEHGFFCAKTGYFSHIFSVSRLVERIRNARRQDRSSIYSSERSVLCIPVDLEVRITWLQNFRWLGHVLLHVRTHFRTNEMTISQECTNGIHLIVWAHKCIYVLEKWD